MSEMSGQTGLRAAGTPVVHESYSFACMRCGHGWEQSYEIEHHRDRDGHAFVVYVADGRIVPSPLSRPGCQNCDGHLVRIMRAGQVSSVLSAARTPRRTAAPGQAHGATDAAVDGEADGAQDPAEIPGPRPHHWHLSDLLHPFQRKAS
ncbi:hypothetical protein ACIPPJ_27560 [Streptomyces sp. NPDC086091]|uniref:hypothetical protein n=1 Tax=Streptomyces sp. NPDC086091 TaxID=3365751 RepID=UPI0037F2711B